jgi:hypothetical protein
LGFKIVESKPDVLITSFGKFISLLISLLEKLGWTGSILGGILQFKFLERDGFIQKPRDNIYMWSSTIPVMDIHVPERRSLTQ